MDHNLEDSLTLESTIEEMDFEGSDVVVSQEDLNLVTGSSEGDIPMEFGLNEEQPMLIGSANEEIIVPDFMGDQFNLQEYSIQDDETTGMTTVENSNQSILAAQSETVVDMKYQPPTVASVNADGQGTPSYIAVKGAPSARVVSSKAKDQTVLATVPRHVAIAPKPSQTTNKFTFSQTKPLAIAPKPIALVSNFMKKIPLVQQTKANSVLAQIGKQLVVLPQGGSQKIKLVNANTGLSSVQYIKTGGDQTQLLSSKKITGIQTSKPMMAKVFVQGQSNSDVNEPVVITKLIPTSGGAQARYIMQQKTVPIAVGKEVVLASPTKQGVRFGKKQQILAIKSPTSKIVPVSSISTATPTTKKMIITPNPTQNVILKTTAPPKAQMTKDGKVVVQSQRTQLHQINVPGKGIQYIRLITNQASGNSTTTTKTSSTVSKGQLVQVSSGKASGSQPPPLVFTGTIAPTEKVLGVKKLVRIAAAPVSTKSQAATQQQASVRSAQSLLAPLSLMEGSSNVNPPSEMMEDEVPVDDWDVGGVEETVQVMLKSEPNRDMEEEVETDADMSGDMSGDSAADSKAALQELLARTASHVSMDLETTENLEEVKSLKGRPDEHPLIVISSNYMGHDNSMTEEPVNQEDMNNMINYKTELAYQSEDTPPDSDVTPSEFGFRPKRACNCTKSQCLKLYCDCFANGEFCNQCNCHNCLNNLDNEELRQKAIRTCLERNPNAFRPKIGKSKIGGPEIIRRHNKGCNCKRSGCLKNYCECYEAKIACTATCKCVGCRNVEDGLQRRRASHAPYRPPPSADLRQPCNFMTTEVIEAVCQCLVAAAAEGSNEECERVVLEEFSRCLQDIIGASRHAAAPPRSLHEVENNIHTILPLSPSAGGVIAEEPTTNNIVSTILHSFAEGRHILTFGQKTGALPPGMRSRLCKLLMERLITAENPVLQTDSQLRSLSLDIGRLFDKESPPLYFTPYLPADAYQSKRNASGWLFIARRARLQHLISLGLIGNSRSRSRSKFSPILERPSYPGIDLTGLIEGDVADVTSALEQLSSPSTGPWQEVSALWQETVRARLRYLYYEEGTLQEYFNKYPILKSSNGWRLLTFDYDALFPDKSGGIDTLAASSDNILKAARTKASTSKDKFLRQKIADILTICDGTGVIFEWSGDFVIHKLLQFQVMTNQL